MSRLIITLNNIRHSKLYPIFGLIALVLYFSGCIYTMILYP